MERDDLTFCSKFKAIITGCQYCNEAAHCVLILEVALTGRANMQAVGKENGELQTGFMCYARKFLVMVL